MKINKKVIVDTIKNFIIKRYILIAVIGFPIVGIIGFGGIVLYNESNSFCKKCHYNTGPRLSLDLQIPAHQGIDKGGPGCIVCHKDKAVQIIFARNLKKTQKFSQRVANLQFKEPVDLRDTYKTEECLRCHPDILKISEVNEPNLPDLLKPIGLKYDHRIHYRYEHFRPEDQKLWQNLRNKSSLSEEQQGELELLEKIRVGNCELCHIKSKKDEMGREYIDKTVNYVARNPIDCTGCHEDARPIQHPGKMLKFPPKETCYKCHHGKMHGKFVIFLADCEGERGRENCIKCHPKYTPEKVAEIRKYLELYSRVYKAK